MASAAGTREGKLPFVVWVLAASTLLMGTTEFVIVGLLPQIADDLGTSVSHAGLLITAFPIGVIVGGPTMALATLRLPRRLTLVAALAVFARRELGEAVGRLQPRAQEPGAAEARPWAGLSSECVVERLISRSCCPSSRRSWT
ncbi:MULTISPECIES: MFS transporter [Streptomyces]|uniref:MFS transporter n=1 Tax=Streptomyces fimbriatus TaxID=68197 RepID=A0ABW0DB12_STRFI